MSESSRCSTRLLSDAPSADDRFGSHQRVADAIAEIIANEEGGKAIGIQGDWGSGKSTIVQLLCSRLASRAEVCALIFDAWAHQGDPLRRTFLDRMVTAAVAKSWVKRESWDEKLEELHGRKQTTVTKETPQLTNLGKLLGLFAVLLPIGAAMLGASIEAGKWVPGLLGALLAFLLPLTVVLNYLFRGNVQDAWTIFTGRSVHEIVTESAVTPDPTSVEFEETFVDLMDAALVDKSRRLVLVLDNLDRVNEKDALTIWATLQTFLQSKEHTKPGWSSQLWIVIPFDREGLSRLWSSKDKGTAGNTSALAQNDGEAGDIEDLPTSFLDKTLQACFDAPPPVLSDWRAYLLDLLREALPDHQEADFHPVYQLFFQSLGVKAPTPRELKIYVNAIGTSHRQWQDEMPLAHLAYLAVLRRQRRPIIDELVSGKIPDGHMSAFLAPSVVEDLAALTFNVESTRAQELLLSAPIGRAIVSGDGAALRDLASKHPNGFWSVLEGMYVRGDLPWDDLASISGAAQCFSQSGLFGEGAPGEARILLTRLQLAVGGLPSWAGLTPEAAEGLVALVQLTSANEDFAKSLIARMSAAQVSNPQEVGEVGLWVSSLFTLLAGFEALGMKLDVVTEGGVPLAIDGTAWLDFSSTLDPKVNRRHLRVLRPTLEDQDLIQAFATRTASASLTEEDTDAISVTRECLPQFSWEPVAATFAARLQVGVGQNPSEVKPLLMALWRIAAWDGQATAKVRDLASQGHLFHQLYVASINSDDETFAWCLMSILRVIPAGAPQAHVGNSAEGQTNLNTYVSSPDSRPDVMAAIDSLPPYLKSAARLFTVLDAQPSAAPFVSRRLTHQLELGSPDQSLTLDLVHQRWQFIRDQVSQEALQHILERMLDEGAFSPFLNGLTFTPAEAPFLLEVARSGGFNKAAVRSFISNGLKEIDGANWLNFLTAEDPIVELAALGVDLHRPIRLGQPFRDALIEHTKRLAQGQVQVTRLAADWPRLADLVEPARRRIFNRRVIEAASDAHGAVPPAFFDLHGASIGDADALHQSAGVFGLLTPLVREGNVHGVKWGSEFLDTHPNFLSKHPDKDAVSEFRDVVEAKLNQLSDGSNEELRAPVERLSKMLP